MRSCFLIVLLLVIYWAVPGSTHNYERMGDTIDPNTINSCKCPVSFAGTVRCGGEINDKIQEEEDKRNNQEGEKKERHIHCHPRLILACDLPIPAERGYYHARTTSKRLDACKETEDCVVEGVKRYCEYSKDPAHKNELSREESSKKESEEEPPPVPAAKLISQLSHLLKAEQSQ